MLQRHADEDAQKAAAIAAMVKQSCLLEAGKAPPPECVGPINGMVSGVQGGGMSGMANGTVCPVTPAGQTPPPGCN